MVFKWSHNLQVGDTVFVRPFCTNDDTRWYQGVVRKVVPTDTVYAKVRTPSVLEWYTYDWSIIFNRDDIADTLLYSDETWRLPSTLWKVTWSLPHPSIKGFCTSGDDTLVKTPSPTRTDLHNHLLLIYLSFLWNHTSSPCMLYLHTMIILRILFPRL